MPGRRTRMPFPALCLALAVGMTFPVAALQAGNYAPVRLVLPIRNVPAYDLTCDFSGLHGNAYRGVRVKVASRGGPVTSDETIRIEIRTNETWQDNYDELVVAYVEIPQGQTAGENVVNIPFRNGLHSAGIKVYQNDELLMATSWSDPYVSRGQVPYRSVDEMPGVLVIDRDMPNLDVVDAWRNMPHSQGSPFADAYKLPDVRRLLCCFPQADELRTKYGKEASLKRATDAELLNTFENDPAIQFCGFEELSTNWLSHSCADLVIISRDDLRELRDKRPECVVALSHLCMAGASLIVVGDKQSATADEVMAEVDQLLTFDAQPTTNSRWNTPRNADWNFALSGFTDNQQRRVNYGRAVPAMPVEAFAFSDRKIPEQSLFHFRTCGNGSMVAWHGENPLPDNMYEWGWIINSLNANQLRWERRMGMSHTDLNRDYWNFLIPGIGQAPVYSFMGLIGLFMLVIGPVNYYLLQRSKRLALLLVTVPLGATLFTLGLVSFALMSDGFTTRARMRSITVLEDGRAACMSRHTYFAAFVPSSGMRVPPDTAVYSLFHQPWAHATGYNQNYFNSDSLQKENETVLRSRYLGAREQRQFMMLRSCDLAASLAIVKVEGKSAESGKVQVENRLGVKIEMAIIHDDTNRIYSITNLEPGKRTEAAEVSDKELRELQVQWYARIRNNDPTFLHSYDEFNRNAIASRQRRYNMYYGGYQQSFGQASQATSVLERGMGQMSQASSRRDPVASRAGDKRGQNLWYAVVDQPPQDDQKRSLAPLAIPARVVTETHAVVGTW